LGFAGRACGIANLLSLRPVTAMSGKKEGDVSDVLEAGSTLYAVRRSPARPTTKLSPASAPSQARRCTVLGGACPLRSKTDFAAMSASGRAQLPSPACVVSTTDEQSIQAGCDIAETRWSASSDAACERFDARCRHISAAGSSGIPSRSDRTRNFDGNIPDLTTVTARP
jgi:hypothetical protein